jgi:hypothetical protein
VVRAAAIVAAAASTGRIEDPQRIVLSASAVAASGLRLFLDLASRNGASSVVDRAPPPRTPPLPSRLFQDGHRAFCFGGHGPMPATVTAAPDAATGEHHAVDGTSPPLPDRRHGRRVRAAATDAHTASRPRPRERGRLTSFPFHEHLSKLASACATRNPARQPPQLTACHAPTVRLPSVSRCLLTEPDDPDDTDDTDDPATLRMTSRASE